MKSKFTVLIAIVCVAFIGMSFIANEPWEVPEKYKAMKNPQADVEDDDEIGADLFDMHCKSCHGAEGYGDGKKSGELESPMRDLTSEEVRAQSDGELYYKSFIGRDEMPNFEKRIKTEEYRWFLINYMKTLE